MPQQRLYSGSRPLKMLLDGKLGKCNLMIMKKKLIWNEIFWNVR